MAYRIIPLTASNLMDLQILYRSVFGSRKSRKFIEGKFDTSYLGISHFGYLAYYRNEPIAFHGAIPLVMKFGDKQEMAAQYGDAMTLPGHAGKGLFTELGNLTDEKLKDAGIRFVWGFPNQNSEYGYKNKLHWTYNERMLGFRIRASKKSLLKVAEKLDIKMHKFYMSLLLKQFNRKYFIKGSVFKEDEVVSVFRNKDYYRYKNFGESIMIEIDGIVFWIKLRGVMLIGDIEINIPGNFDNALYKLKTFATKYGISELIFQASPGTEIESLLRDRADETFISWAVGFKNFSSHFPLNHLKFTLGDLDTF